MEGIWMDAGEYKVFGHDNLQTVTYTIWKKKFYVSYVDMFVSYVSIEVVLALLKVL